MDRDHDRKPHDVRSIEDVKREFERYAEIVNASDRAHTTKSTYIQHAERFVRWLEGRVTL